VEIRSEKLKLYPKTGEQDGVKLLNYNEKLMAETFRKKNGKNKPGGC